MCRISGNVAKCRLNRATNQQDKMLYQEEISSQKYKVAGATTVTLATSEGLVL